ncbi:unnamed protein product [Gadus morhua 'NCC']
MPPPLLLLELLLPLPDLEAGLGTVALSPRIATCSRAPALVAAATSPEAEGCRRLRARRQVPWQRDTACAPRQQRLRRQPGGDYKLSEGVRRHRLRARRRGRTTRSFLEGEGVESISSIIHSSLAEPREG